MFDLWVSRRKHRSSVEYHTSNPHLEHPEYHHFSIAIDRFVCNLDRYPPHHLSPVGDLYDHPKVLYSAAESHPSAQAALVESVDT